MFVSYSEGSTFSAVISCNGKLVSHDNLNKVINNLPSAKIKQLFPLPLKTGNQRATTATPPADEVGIGLG